MKKEFAGNREEILPSELIDKDNFQEFESFFLILGMIFNDIKGLMIFEKLLKENYRTPAMEEVSAHTGEYAGILVQINKLFIGVVSEFLLFLEKNKDLMSRVGFQLLLKDLDSETRAKWNKLVDPSNNTNSVISTIKRIRSNVSFHYDHSGGELRKGFIRSFFNEAKDLVQHKKAYFSSTGDIESTRFYFSDAAAEEYIKSLVNGENMDTLKKVVFDMNSTIQIVMACYLMNLKKYKFK